MMYLGNQAVGLATSINESPWKIKHIITESSLSNAQAVADWIKTIIPANTIAVIIRDDYHTNPRDMGTLKVATFYGVTPGIYIRNRNGVEGTASWSSSYDLGFNAGDAYTIYYQEVT